MTSPTSLLYDAYYHIYHRGKDQDIFIEEHNYEFFLNLHFKYMEPVVETFAYCMLRNHYHMLVRVRPEKEIEEFLRFSETNKPLDAGYPGRKFSDLFNAYTRTIHDAYGRSGDLFQEAFGHAPVTTDRQFWKVITCIHRNPQKHKLVKDFREWKHSSYDVILSDEPTKLKRDAVLEWFGGRDEYLKLHEKAITDADSKWFAEHDPD